MADQDQDKTVTAPAAPVAAPWATPTANAAPSPDSAAPAAPAADSVVTKVEAPVADAEIVAKVEAEVVDMVTVTVPKAFKLTQDDHSVKEYRAGVQEMERSHAEHWYAKVNGVEIYEPKAK